MKSLLYILLAIAIVISAIGACYWIREYHLGPESSIETSIDSTVSTIRRIDTVYLAGSKFSEVQGRDTVLQTDTVYRSAGVPCGSFNFFAISDAWGSSGQDTIWGVADCYGKRLLNVNVRPAPIVKERWDTLIHVRETTREKVVEKVQPLFSISAHGLYDPFHANYGGGAEATIRLANLQLFARPEFTLQYGGSAYLGARFYIWEK